jgi:putative ABC transport system permease protein
VTPGYFAAMRIPLLAGRGFTAADTREAARVAIVDETLARRWWPGEDAVGKTLLWKRGDQELTVVGVARHVRHYGLEAEGKEQVYRPYAQYANAASVTVALRSAGPPEALAGVVRAEVARLDRAPPVSDVRTMEALVGESLGPARFHTLSFGAFGAFALVLAAVGVYGVVAYSVSARTREIGVRLALGARPGDVVRLVMRQGVGIVAAGVVIGAALALLSARLIAGLLHGVSPTDPGVLAGVAALLAATGLLSALLPAARAARVEPGTALRAE